MLTCQTHAHLSTTQYKSHCGLTFKLSSQRTTEFLIEEAATAAAAHLDSSSALMQQRFVDCVSTSEDFESLEGLTLCLSYANDNVGVGGN